MNAVIVFDTNRSCLYDKGVAWFAKSTRTFYCEQVSGHLNRIPLKLSAGDASIGGCGILIRTITGLYFELKDGSWRILPKN
jgi:hypothetical protein